MEILDIRQTCQNCRFNDGMIYTSNPPKYKCTFDNQYYDCLHKRHLDLKPTKSGKWIDRGYEVECPFCGFTCNDTHYLGNGVACPNCAARMDR